jgi:signal transduction histidine kinase
MNNRTTDIASYNDLLKEIKELQYQLQEATDTIEAIRTGQIDALVVERGDEHQIYTLKSADHSYRVFIENMTEGAVTLNSKGDIQYCNSSFARLLKRPLAGMLGASFDTFIADSSKDQFHALVQQGWHQDCRGEILLRTAGNDPIPVQLSFTVLDLEGGNSLSIIITDLSAQKATQKQLEANNRELEASNNDLQQFASVASHDLQEPLRKIQVFSNLIKEQETGLSPEHRLYLDKIIDSSTRMRSLIIDILTYSRLSANDVAHQEVNLDELLNDLRYDFELIIQEKQAIITIDPLPVIVANKGQIRQVFQNIISNALKFSKPGTPPRISITAKTIAEKSFESKPANDGCFSLICIQDNGIGFDEKYVNNIFALFERLNTKNAYSGTGIGLAIAKKIIEKHDGMITATGKEGEGASFMIILPIT